MDNMNESVGKKIVEALKRQAENDLSPASVSRHSFKMRTPEPEPVKEVQIQTIKEDVTAASNAFSDIFADNDSEPVMATTPISSPKPSMFDDSFDSISSSFSEPASSTFPPVSEPTVFEMPSNIVVLKKLISQLPSGVSRHTGAQIIKQTMEALGISMRSVLQDAQQVQENLKNSAKECQSYIQEYKKQIVSLEKQSQNYQKQYAALNDLISLFIQANK